MRVTLIRRAKHYARSAKTAGNGPVTDGGTGPLPLPEGLSTTGRTSSAGSCSRQSPRRQQPRCVSGGDGHHCLEATLNDVGRSHRRVPFDRPNCPRIDQ